MTEPQENTFQKSLPFPPQIVTKSNDFCRARWPADSILEARIIAQIASRVNPGDDRAMVYSIPAIELLGKNYQGSDLRELRKVAEKIVRRTVSMNLADGDGWGVYALLISCEYKDSTGVFTAEIHPKIRPHFLWFKDNILQYTQYNLLEFMKLPSMYSQRIFELLKSWKDKPGFVVPIDDFHEMLATPKTYRQNFQAFRERVLEKAHLDIHKYTSLRYSWTAIKDGRRVGAIQFSFSGRRIGEQQLEDAEKEQGKALAKSRKRTMAFRDASACAKEKKGVCTSRDRAKLVCSICDEMDILRGFALKFEQHETQTNQ